MINNFSTIGLFWVKLVWYKLCSLSFGILHGIMRSKVNYTNSRSNDNQVINWILQEEQLSTKLKSVVLWNMPVCHG